MKIAAKLAYSQLKVNRSRTKWTLVAIALSTALITAVCSFFASGNEMLKGFLGEDYGEYATSYRVLLLIPAVIFGILIMAMSVTVISNVFRISAQERIMQFGVLKCTGATKKQITDTVMYESVWLCAVGIPAGICLGLLLAFAGIGVANHFLNDLASLAHMMFKEINLTLHFSFSWLAVLFSSVFSFLIVLYSAWRPARKAAKVPAIQCIHGSNEIKVNEKQLKENPLVHKFFGFEGTLADRNLKRNRRNFRATVISLSVGVILFVSLGGLAKQAQGMQKFMDLGVKETIITEYISAYDREINESTGREETTYLHPIKSELGNQITQELKEYKNIDIWGMGSDADTYHAVVPKSVVSSKMQEISKNDAKDNYEFPVEIITLDEKNYEKMCKRAKVPVGSTILLNYYWYNDSGHKTDLKPFQSDITKVQLVKADGSQENMRIQGILTQKDIPAELFYVNMQPVRLIVPKATVRAFSWYSAPENKKEFMEFANQVMAKEFPSDAAKDYMEEGFNTRVFKIDEYMKVMNIAISLVSIFMYSFVGLLMLIGLTNVISTLSTNVMMRAKEFAVLKSVGMTPESLRSMLSYESILCSLKALMIGVPVGLVITIAINLPIRSMFPVPYQIPLLSIFLCIVVVFLITLGTTRYAVRKLKNQDIIETIRSECGK